MLGNPVLSLVSVPFSVARIGVNFHPGVGGISSSGFGSGASKSSLTVGEKELWLMRYDIVSVCHNSGHYRFTS
jgi:hypothetical protein